MDNHKRAKNARALRPISIQPSRRHRLSLLAGGTIPILVVIIVIWSILTYPRFLDDWGFGIFFLSPIVIWGLISAPANLRWAKKNPAAELGPLGITYISPPRWNPTLVPWQTFRGAKLAFSSNRDNAVRVVGIDILSGPPYAYGLTCKSGTFTVRRPRKAGRTSSRALRIPISDEIGELDKTIEKINRYYRSWQALPAQDRPLVHPDVPNGTFLDEDPLGRIVYELSVSQGQQVLLGQSSLALFEDRWRYARAAALSILGMGFCAIVCAGSIGAFRQEADGESLAIAVGFGLGTLACLGGFILNLLGTIRPPALRLDQGGIYLPRRVGHRARGVPWSEVDSVRATGSGWEVRGKGIDLPLRAFGPYTSEEIGMLVNGYHLAWLDAATG